MNIKKLFKRPTKEKVHIKDDMRVVFKSGGKTWEKR